MGGQAWCVFHSVSGIRFRVLIAPPQVKAAGVAATEVSWSYGNTLTSGVSRLKAMSPLIFLQTRIRSSAF